MARDRAAPACLRLLARQDVDLHLCDVLNSRRSALSVIASDSRVISSRSRMATVSVLHVDLLVRDMAASIAFYTEQLGGEIVDDTVVTGEAVAHALGASDARLRIVVIRYSPTGAMIELQQVVS